MNKIELKGWKGCSLPDGRTYLEKIVNGHELRIIAHPTINQMNPENGGKGPNNTEVETGLLGFMDKAMLLGTYELEACAAFLEQTANLN